MINDINILMLGGAKRVSVATKIALMAYRMELRANLFSWELSPVLPIASVAEIVPGARWSDPDILEKLHKVVTEKKIDIIIPFVDGAIGVTAAYIEKYGNVRAPLGSYDSVNAMFDKCIAACRFEEAGLPIPDTYSADNHRFPMIAKPRCGSASSGILIIHNEEEFNKIRNSCSDYLLQQYIPDAEEITVDCYRSREGEIIAVVPRIRLEVLAGEVTRTRTIRDNEIDAVCRKALEALDLKGAVTIQFLRDRKDSRLKLMEINPRLGGGVVCSIHAGANFPEFILSDAIGLKMEPCTNWRENVEIVRYMQEVVFENGEVIG